mmetsp:Transcript_92416/g.299023  ORF Transcript_92416/g.299023 Transcript_92416/m.299023 type:complete len:115 (+) Transcript_92416:1829-2173(+)
MSKSLRSLLPSDEAVLVAMCRQDGGYPEAQGPFIATRILNSDIWLPFQHSVGWLTHLLAQGWQREDALHVSNAVRPLHLLARVWRREGHERGSARWKSEGTEVSARELNGSSVS